MADKKIHGVPKFGEKLVIFPFFPGYENEGANSALTGGGAKLFFSVIYSQGTLAGTPCGFPKNHSAEDAPIGGQSSNFSHFFGILRVELLIVQTSKTHDF